MNSATIAIPLILSYLVLFFFHRVSYPTRSFPWVLFFYCPTLRHGTAPIRITVTRTSIVNKLYNRIYCIILYTVLYVLRLAKVRMIVQW